MITPGQMHKWHGNTSSRTPTEARDSCWLRRFVLRIRCWGIYWTRRLRCRRLGPDGARHKYWPNAFEPLTKEATAEWWGNADGVSDHSQNGRGERPGPKDA